MILEIRLENFFSIREEVTIDFRAGKIRSSQSQALASNVMDWNGRKVLKSIGLFGANAAGKSNVLKAIDFCCRMILQSHLHNENVVFNFQPFKFGDWGKLPSRFTIDFVHEDVEYEYSFSLTRTEIISESLYRFPKGRKAKVFVRDETIEGGKSDKYSFGEGIPRPLDVAENTSRKTLFLTSASQKDRELAKSIFRFFNERFLLNLVPPNDKVVEELFLKHKPLVLSALKFCDSDIVDVRCVREKVEGWSVTSDLLNGAPPSSIARPGPTEVVRFETSHKHQPSISFDLVQEESLGTPRMFNAMLRLITVVHENKTLMLDEFDASLHIRIAEFILDLIHASDGAQLLYTTHNTRLIDMQRLRRDQIVFINKNRDGATEAYPLFDFKDFRENMDAEKGYLQGRFEAVPVLGGSVDALKHEIVSG